MSSRHKIYWRVYIYANSLYSLPSRGTCSFRPWNPVVYRRKSYELQRIMNWANRDLSVLLRSSKWEMLVAYDAILNLLPFVSMKSQEFRDNVQVYLGDKTHHFVHELINFARSPYDDLISYECNVQYCTIDKLVPDGDAGNWPTVTKGSDLHSFVEFSRRINDDDCSGFEADLGQDNPEWEHSEESGPADWMERPVTLLRRTESNNPEAFQRPTPPQFSDAPNSASTQAPQVRPVPHLPSSPQLPQTRRFMPPGVNSQELDMALERSMLTGQVDENSFFISNTNGIYMNVPQLGRETTGPGDLISPQPVPPMARHTVVQNGRGAARRNRRQRNVGWGHFNLQ